MTDRAKAGVVHGDRQRKAGPLERYSEENVSRFDEWMATKCFSALIARVSELELSK